VVGGAGVGLRLPGPLCGPSRRKAAPTGTTEPPCVAGGCGRKILNSEERSDDQLHIGPGIPPTQLRATIARTAPRLVVLGWPVQVNDQSLNTL